MVLGVGPGKSVEVDYIPLLCGRTLRGSTYGGVRTQSDLPKIIEKCVNKVYIYVQIINVYIHSILLTCNLDCCT